MSNAVGNKQLAIGSLELTNDTVLAPLAGITNLPLRLLAKDFGCALVCSEMVSANGLVRQGAKTLRLLDSTPREKPLSVQIFGADPVVMADAAQIVAASGADVIDINFGCSVKKILKAGAGAALMRSPAQAEAVLRAVRRAIDLPLTIKIRSGWDRSGDQALTMGRLAEDCGVDAISLHPRTATQGFSGRADWTLIRRLKANVALPVIGNGDIDTAKDAIRMKNETGCDGVMVGRAAIGRPYLFSQILAAERGLPEPSASLDLRIRLMLRYLAVAVDYLGEETACYQLRSRLTWFAKGIRQASRFRESIRKIGSKAEAMDCILALKGRP
jgi:nifR3 family TIM-barrel protein